MVLRMTSSRWQSAKRLLAVSVLLLPLAGCFGFGGGTGATVKRGAFTSKEFGVSASPRVTNNPNPPKGGGRYLVGKPYTVRGQVYTPQENPQGYMAEGKASWYGSDFHGRLTANGEIFSANAITGAHPTLPLPSYARVTNRENGRSVIVRINDRGPYLAGRVVDLSHRAADMLGYVNNGSANVDVQYVGPAPLDGDDTRMLVASYQPGFMPDQGNTRFANAAPQQSNNIADAFMSLFSYADGVTPEAENLIINDAHAAALAMATRPAQLQDWVQSVDEDARAIKLQLGVFSDTENAFNVATSFAVLGAVDEAQVEMGARTGTRLTLTHLKPGVARSDVLKLAQELGLTDIVLY